MTGLEILAVSTALAALLVMLLAIATFRWQLRLAVMTEQTLRAQLARAEHAKLVVEVELSELQRLPGGRPAAPRPRPPETQDSDCAL